MFAAFIALALAGQVPFTGDPTIYCRETSGRAVPLDLTLSQFADAFRHKYGYSSLLYSDGRKTGLLEFRGGYENIETVTYIVGYDRGVVLKKLHVKQIVEENTLVGNAMCGWTVRLLLDQQ